MKCSVNPNTLRASASIVMAVCIWPIICYAFVLNGMQLISSYSNISRLAPAEGNNEIPISTKIAMTITVRVIQISSEAIMVVSLVFQYMSAFDYLTGPEYENHWKVCHRNIFCLNSIVFTITCCLYFTNYENNSLFSTSLIELLAVMVNFIFLLVAVIVDLEENDKRVSSVWKIGDILYKIKNSSSKPRNDEVNETKFRSARNSNYNLNINSFLDNTSPTSEKEKKSLDIVV